MMRNGDAVGRTAPWPRETSHRVSEARRPLRQTPRWLSAHAALGGLSMLLAGCGGQGEPTPQASPDPDTPTATQPAETAMPTTPSPLPSTPGPTPTPLETPTATAPPETPIPTPPLVWETQARRPYAEQTVQVERVLVPADAVPANPSPGASDTGPAQSPPNTQYASFLRYHYAESTRDVETILLCMPGFQGGAGGFDYIGRALVDAGEGRIEVWAIDRRSNLLEDHLGTEAAEALSDPTEALTLGMEYYFNGLELEGQQFAGFLENPDLPYLSEWGLSLTLQDAMTIAQRVPEALRNQVLFLAGHSLGGTLTEVFAAWDFDQNPETRQDAGYQQLAGLVLLDGSLEPSTSRVTSQTDYEASVAKLRSGESSRTAAFAGLTTDVNVLLELFATAEVRGPAQEAPMSQIYDYEGVNELYLKTLYGKGRYTYRAVLGLAVDDNFQTAYVFEASVGFLHGGDVTPYQVNGTTYYRPADTQGGTLYGWLDYPSISGPMADPQTEELSHIDDMAYTAHLGEASFTEWYFPSRLSTDLGLVLDLNNQADGSDWRYSLYGMSALQNAQVDIPVLGFFSDVAAPSTGLSAYQASIAQTLRTGQSRAEGFEIHILDGYEHLDVLVADWENPARPNAVLTRLMTWFPQFGLLGQDRGIPLVELEQSLSEE